VERRAGRELGSLLGLGAISGSESASSTTAPSTAPPAQPASPTGHSASYPTANNISISVPGFLHRQFRHASALASLCLSSPSLHSLFIIPFAHSFIAPLFVPAACITRVHANHLPTSYSCLKLCPPTSAHPRLRHTRSLPPSIHPSIHQRLRNLHNCLDHEHPR
jgi:hypothetical protein